MSRFEDQPDADGFCEDPRHDDDCTCGARPDHQYESRMEDRL